MVVIAFNLQNSNIVSDVRVLRDELDELVWFKLQAQGIDPSAVFDTDDNVVIAVSLDNWGQDWVF